MKKPIMSREEALRQADEALLDLLRSGKLDIPPSLTRDDVVAAGMRARERLADLIQVGEA